MTNDKWTRILKPFVVVACLIAMYISAIFSVDGFNFQIPEKQWIGWALAFLIIVFEFAWAKAGENLTLFCVGIFCYGYGLTTNVLGIVSYRGGITDWTDYILPVIFGAFLEIAPEPFLAWAISGDTTSDPIGKIIKRLFGEGNSYPVQSISKSLGNLPRKRF
jgi:hypothetical protein